MVRGYNSLWNLLLGAFYMLIVIVGGGILLTNPTGPFLLPVIGAGAIVIVHGMRRQQMRPVSHAIIGFLAMGLLFIGILAVPLGLIDTISVGNWLLDAMVSIVLSASLVAGYYFATDGFAIGDPAHQ